MTLNNSGFTSGLKRSQQQLDGFAKSIRGIGATIAGALAVREITDQLGRLVDRATEIRDRSAEIGVDTQSFQKLQFFLEQSSGRSEQLSSAFRSIARNRERALAGDAGLLRAFDQLNISAERLQNSRVEDIFFDIANAVRTTDTQSIIDPLTRIAETEVTKIIPALKTDLQALFDEAESRGVLISDEEIAKISALGDQLLTLKRQFQSLAADVGTPAIEGITNLVSGLQDVLSRYNRSADDLLSAADAFKPLDQIDPKNTETKQVIKQSLDQSTDLRDQLIVKLVEDAIGDRDRDRVIQRAEEIKVALGEQFEALELDDDGLIRSNKDLEVALNAAVRSLTSQDFQRARLSIATGGRDVGEVIRDQRQGTDQVQLDAIRIAVGDERFEEIFQSIQEGGLEIGEALEDAIRSIQRAAVERGVQAAQLSREDRLVSSLGTVQIQPLETGLFEQSLQRIIDESAARLRELQQIVQASPALRESVQPEVSRLTDTSSLASEALTRIENERIRLNDLALGEIPGQIRRGLTGEFQQASRSALAVGEDRLVRSIISDRRRQRDRDQQSSQIDELRQFLTIPESVEQTVTRRLDFDGQPVTPEDVEFTATQNFQTQGEPAAVQDQQVTVTQTIVTDDQTRDIPAPEDTVTRQTVVTDDQTEPVDPPEDTRTAPTIRKNPEDERDRRVVLDRIRFEDDKFKVNVADQETQRLFRLLYGGNKTRKVAPEEFGVQRVKKDTEPPADIESTEIQSPEKSVLSTKVGDSENYYRERLRQEQQRKFNEADAPRTEQSNTAGERETQQPDKQEVARETDPQQESEADAEQQKIQQSLRDKTLSELKNENRTFDFDRQRVIPDLQRAGIFSRGFVDNNPGFEAQNRQLAEAQKQTQLMQQNNQILNRIAAQRPVVRQ
jgi:hypothetical protein